MKEAPQWAAAGNVLAQPGRRATELPSSERAAAGRAKAQKLVLQSEAVVQQRSKAKVRLDVPAPELPALLLSTVEEAAKPRLLRPAQTPAASAGRLDSSATNFSDSASGAGGAALPDGEDGSMKLQEGSRVLDIERAVNGGVAIGVLLCVHETDPKQVDVRYDDGTCRRLLPESRFKLLVEPSVREGP